MVEQKTSSPWDLEEVDESKDAVAKTVNLEDTEYKVKAHLVLEDSETAEWGVVKDCHGNINMIPPDADVVGTWSRYGDGTYWVSITTPIEAMLDRYTQLALQLSKARADGDPLLHPKSTTRKTRTKSEKVEVDEGPSETVSKLDGLLNRLKR